MSYREKVRDAIQRHVNDALEGASLELPVDPQPAYVMQWFPDRDLDPNLYGHDPRKHAVALSFLIPLNDDVSARRGWGGVAI